MVQFFGKILKVDSFVFQALKSLYGLNTFQIKVLCSKSNIGLNCRMSDLSQIQVVQLLKEIEFSGLEIETSLQQKRMQSIKKLIDIKTFKGFRHVGRYQKII